MEDIKKREFKNAYLLYGEETYLKRQYKKKLQEAILGNEDTMNLNIYVGKGIDITAVMDQADTLPFFADHRLILIEDSKFFKSANEELVRYLKQIPKETIFLFVEDEVDKRNKLYKTIKSIGRVTEFARQDEKTLIKWILSILKKEEKKITQQTMEMFLEKTGNDMENIAAELEKLICYTMGREVITQEDVAEILISRQFHLLMQVKELYHQGYDQRQIAEQIGLQSFIVKNYIRQASLFSKNELEQAVKDCVETEEAVKTGKMQDILSVELLIVKYSQKKAFD